VAVVEFEDVAVVEVVEGNMVVDRMVEDCMVDKAVGTRVDSMVEPPEAFGVDSLSFAD
jgi:FKBP-type peptidyl-prolyl cis-trans isomerase 2